MQRTIYLSSLLIIILDFIVKTIMLTNSVNLTIIPNFFYLTLVTNTGGAFSILSNYTWLLIIVAVVVIYFMTKYIKENKLNKLQSLSMSLLFGGIIGNLIDRVVYGYVIDYFRFIILNYKFPIFNIADICITIGVIMLIIDLIRGDSNEFGNTRRKQ